MIYNKKLVTTPPKTSAELVAIGEEAHRPDSRHASGSPTRTPTSTTTRRCMNGFGGGVFDAGQQAGPEQPAEREVARAPDEVVRRRTGSSRPSRRRRSSRRSSTRARRRSSSPAPGSWARSRKGVDYGLAPLPTIDEAGGKPMRPWMTVEGVYIAAPSKNKDAAYDFAKYLTDAAGGEDPGARGPPDPGEQGGLRRPAGRGGPGAQGLPRAGRGRGPDAERAGDDDGLVAGHDRDEHDRQEGGDAEGGAGRGAEGGRERTSRGLRKK